MIPQMDHEWRIPRSAHGDPELLRSNIPEYFLVGHACAPAAENAVSLTLALVTNGPYPEARPVRVLVSRKMCGDLAVALARFGLAFPVHEGASPEPSDRSQAAFSLLCETFPPGDRASLCASIKALRPPFTASLEARQKLAKDALKYPVDKAKNRNVKYTEL